MTNKRITFKRHVGYDASKSAEWNVLKGRREGESYKRIYEQLNGLAAVTSNEPDSAVHKTWAAGAAIAKRQIKKRGKR